MGERGKGFETREKREERQLNQIGWSFLTPTPLHTSTHTHTHIHILSLPASGSHGACTFAGRQAGDQSCSGTSVYVCKRRVSNMLVAACAVLVKVQC